MSSAATETKRQSPRPEWLDRTLHRAYMKSAGPRYFFTRRILPAGVGLAAVQVISCGLLIGYWNNDAVHQIFSLAFAIGFIAFFWMLARRANIRAIRELPRYGTVDEVLRYHLHVTNLARRRLSHAWLSETAPDPRPNYGDFRFSREPGEHERNWFDRTLAYYRWKWLIYHRRLFEGGKAKLPLDLAPGETKMSTIEFIPLRRGVTQLEDLRVLLPDPFGLLQRCRRTQTATSTLTVLPKRYRLPNFEMPGNTRFQIGGDATANAIGNSGEFVGLRDYRPGDPLRQIHWKSWARTGRPIVKELEDTFYPRYGLILDTFSTPNEREIFEAAVSVAASFVVTLDSGESLLDLMFIKDKAHMVTAGRGVARTETLLEVLAGVHSESEPAFEPLTNLVLKHRELLTSCLVVLCGWDSHRAEFLQNLERGGVLCSALVLGIGPRPQDAPIPGQWLNVHQLEQDLHRLPRRLPTLN
ncbi:DUF58 domain-containing protein [Luteolibacter pohnpeiensis]|uniref:DUF58 domain-containing protein n=1 Tax=Luteolibacter pohnpeiensis TaxID=454153 RepID=A0A934VTL9_9BACT|nr:DUF58 domain-containing protein [Luteolibacter pohnpeiensis]MBK1881617.1 DUF58 domain-containing protein [Luteolibacter pohnpeiensis]